MYVGIYIHTYICGVMYIYKINDQRSHESRRGIWEGLERVKREMPLCDYIIFSKSNIFLKLHLVIQHFFQVNGIYHEKHSLDVTEFLLGTLRTSKSPLPSFWYQVPPTCDNSAPAAQLSVTANVTCFHSHCVFPLQMVHTLYKACPHSLSC